MDLTDFPISPAGHELNHLYDPLIHFWEGSLSRSQEVVTVEAEPHQSPSISPICAD